MSEAPTRAEETVPDAGDRSAAASSGGTAIWSNATANVYAVTGRISYKFGGF